MGFEQIDERLMAHDLDTALGQVADLRAENALLREVAKAGSELLACVVSTTTTQGSVAVGLFAAALAKLKELDDGKG